MPGGASGSTPNKAWMIEARAVLDVIGFDAFKPKAMAWFALADKSRTQAITDWNREYQPDPNQLIIEPHADILKGLVWCCALRENKEIARALTVLALSAYRKVPKIGPRAVKIGNACVYALGAMPGMEGVGQLALLKVRVKFGTTQKMIEKAVEATAKRVGLPREELEEMAVPAYGLTSVGVCEEPMGEFTARLTVTGSGGTEIGWFKADGKTQKSVPASVKAEHAEELKELQGAAKDIQRMLPAQRERIDTLFLQQKSWPLAVWRERYLDHPLVGVIARRLIWEFTTEGKTTTGIWFEPTGSRRRESAQTSSSEGNQRGLTSAATGALVDLDLRPIASLGAETTVRSGIRSARTPTKSSPGARGWTNSRFSSRSSRRIARSICSPTPSGRRGPTRTATPRTSCGSISSTPSAPRAGGRTSCACWWTRSSRPRRSTCPSGTCARSFGSKARATITARTRTRPARSYT
jgi:hypothetical protein